ncbi:MAG: polysaccharide biosynthesis/export family protein, partial [Verrucomicrobiota bacterium]|nr:polysaccharide biosynthesis/export family protein [Verrucomicrobiota bacterium]
LVAQMSGDAGPQAAPQKPAGSTSGASLLPNASVKPPVSSAAQPAALTVPTPLPQSYEIAFDQLRMLDAAHEQLVSRQRTIQPFKISPPGYFRILLPAAADQAVADHPWIKIGLCSLLFGMLGIIIATGEIVLRELMDSRLKTGADLMRVTRLPLLATLGNLRRMSAGAQETWAFRTWIALQHRLGLLSEYGLICGLTSSRPGEGRSTWLRLLGQAASQRGFRVLTITAPPTVETEAASGDNDSTEALVLSAPVQVTEKFIGPDAQSIVKISLPGWVWTLERRKQLQAALDLWRQIDNIAILVELPPASFPETVLLAEILPNIIWLAESGRPDAAATREQIQTLQNAHCHLVGAMLNRTPRPFLNKRFVRWAGNWAAVLLITLMLTHRGFAAAVDTGPSAAQTDEIQSGVPPDSSAGNLAQRAPWQQHLTLGPGDVLNLSLFGQPELARENVPIGPDGRISYLEAQNVMAAGLTVDELRARLNDELSKFRRAPQVIVTPAAYRSKKYFVLGKVERSGVFMLDRPITIIEAVARAHGLETGFIDHNLVDLADLSRSFLARQGKHMPVDFEKLFMQGDLSQNIQLEPNDYLYFPAADVKEVYVLGEVRFPGPMSYTQDVNAIAAIAGRGGFTQRAWKGRVLVVRGSLNNPTPFVVNVVGALKGQAPNFQLQPKDIVYVSSRPWIRAEELLDTVASAFVESATVTATGLHVTTNVR